MQYQTIQAEVTLIPQTPMIPPRQPAPADQPALPPQPLIYLGQKMTWQYKTVVRELSAAAALTDADLNQLGAEGWELAGVLTVDRAVHFYFKRPQR